MTKKYFFFDIDGTLTDGKSFMGGIPESAIHAIAKLRKEGHEVAIASGRPYVAAKEFAKDAGIDNIVCNGGYTCYVHGEFIRNQGMKLEDCHKVIQQCLSSNIPFLVATSDDFTFYTHKDTFSQAIEGDAFHAKIDVQSDIDYFTLPSIVRMMIALKRGDEAKIKNFGSLVPSRYHEHYVIVEPDDKYEGIQYMLEALGGKEEDVIVFGDGLNDVKMFEKAAFSIAMGNGVDILKEKANYVTKRSDEDGLAFALKHFGWIS